MKLNPSSIQQPISSFGRMYILNQDYAAYSMRLQRPNPPTPEAVKRAQFVDKTYHWNHK